LLNIVTFGPVEERPETMLDNNEAQVSVCQLGSLPLCFKPHLLPFLPPEFSATFKIIHGGVRFREPRQCLDLKRRR
jgi:hypothetical protein